jgi:cytoskeletal protein CcmA (bactofilin family)
MFKKPEEEILIKEAETIIGPSIKVKGDFHGDGNIVIEGVLEGGVKTSKDLFVGNKAIIKAEIEAKNAKIGGNITGNLKINNYTEITSQAKIFGNIETQTISIERGAVINGKITMGQIQQHDKNETSA